MTQNLVYRKKGYDAQTVLGSQYMQLEDSEKDLSFKIYDDINEKFAELENYFETKSECSLDSLDEEDAFDYDPLTGEIKITRKDVEVFEASISEIEENNANESNNDMFEDDPTEEKIKENKSTNDSLPNDVVSFFALHLRIS